MIQPLTMHICVQKVIRPTPISSLLSEEMSLPRLHGGIGDLAGIVQHPGVWPFKMPEEALKSLLDAMLPPLPTDELEVCNAGLSKQLHMSSDNTDLTSKSCKAQGWPTHHGKGSTTSVVTPHPSLQYCPGDISEILLLWVKALSVVGMLALPVLSSAHFWPPPFASQGAGKKCDCYYHNYI